MAQGSIRKVLKKEEALDVLKAIERQINSIIIGQEELLRKLLVGLFTEIQYSLRKEGADDEVQGGCAHILLEGVPGVAKTLAVVAISSVIHARFQRIQLTPDLLPADIVGTRIFDPAEGKFSVEHGPIFTNILLTDEINRATPKTQSALLEAMQERQVTIGESTYPLDDPFWVLATQNPVEQEGVYVLPEAQLDRFSMMLRMGYPGHDDELQMLKTEIGQVQLKAVIDPGTVVAIRKLIRRTYVDDRLREYIVRVGRATRDPAAFGLDDIQDSVTVGISPRAYHHVLALSKTVAFLDGRDYVLPEDVKDVGLAALRHRIIRSVQAEAANVSTDEILAQILGRVPIP